MINIKSLLFQNTGTRQTIFKNTFWLTLAEVISSLLRLFLIIYVIRVLGPTEYGKFAFAFSFVSIMVIFSDLGIVEIITREFSRDASKEKEFPAVLGLEIALDAIAFTLMFIGSFFITADPSIRHIIWVLAVFILITSSYQAFSAFLRSRQKMEYEAGFKIFQGIALVGLSLGAIYTVPTALNLSYAYLISNVIALVFIIVSFHFYFQRFFIKWDWKVWKHFLQLSWPLSLGFDAGWTYIVVSSVMLGYFNLITENGWYNASSKIAFSALIPATLVIKSFYPALSNFFVTSKEKLQKSFYYLCASIIFLTAPVVVGGMVLAPKIIGFFYGPDFNPSIFIFQILVLIIGIVFLTYPYSLLLVVVGHQKKNFMLIVGGGLLDIALNIFLVPRYGLFGALIATMVATLVIFFLTVAIAKYVADVRLVNLQILKTALIAGLCSYGMLLVLSQPAVFGLNIIFSIALGGAAYLGAFFLLWKSLEWIEKKYITTT